MNLLKPRMRLLRLLLCIIVTVVILPVTGHAPLTTSAVAIAAPTTPVGAIDEAGLEVHISFPNDQLHAQWYVHVKRTYHGKVIFDRTERMMLHCNLHGDVQIKEESARLRAEDQSYISCTLPSLRETVYRLTEKEPGGPIQLGKQCDCKNAWVAAKISLEPSTGAAEPSLYDNPLFYHPDFQYYVPQIHGPTDPLLHVQYDGVTEPYSDLFQPDTWNVIWTGIDGAEFLNKLGDWGHYFNAYDLSKLPLSRHWANGEVLRHANEPSEFQLTTDETMIYIGYNPATQTYSDMIVKHVDWDPPCFGAGGG